MMNLHLHWNLVWETDIVWHWLCCCWDVYVVCCNR